MAEKTPSVFFPEVHDHPPVISGPCFVGAGVSKEDALSLVERTTQTGGIHHLTVLPWKEFDEKEYWTVPATLSTEEIKIVLGYAKASYPNEGLDIVLDPQRIPNTSLAAQLGVNDTALSLLILPHDESRKGTLPTIEASEFVEKMEPLKPIVAELQETQKQYIDSFMNRVGKSRIELPDTLATRLAFEQYISGQYDTNQLIQQLTRSGIPRKEVNTIILQYLETGESGQVIDRRESLTFEERFGYLKAQMDSLSDVGREYVLKLDKAIVANDTEAITELRGQFPTIANLHLEYFKPLDENVLHDVLPKTSILQIEKGCSHACRHCYLAAKRNMAIMPFQRIVQITDAQISIGEKAPRPILLYHDNEPFDYYDPVYDADLGDVFEVMYNKSPQTRLQMTTRGWFLGDAIAPRAAKKLQQLLERSTNKLTLRVSLDLYDMHDGDYAGYILRKVQLLDSLSPHSISLVTPYDEQNEQITKIVRQIVVALSSSPEEINYEPDMYVSKAGRGKSLPTSKMTDPGTNIVGLHIKPDGRVFNVTPDDMSEDYDHTTISTDTNIKLWNSPDLSVNELIPKRVMKQKGKHN